MDVPRRLHSTKRWMSSSACLAPGQLVGTSKKQHVLCDFDQAE